LPKRTDFSTAAHAERMGLAIEALLWVLGSDPRVQRAYQRWRLDHELFGVLDDATFRARMLRDKDRDLERLDRLVREELKLPYAWLPQELLRDFGLTVIGEVAGETLGPRYQPVTDGLPAGRRPKHDGEHIARDIEWLYRTTIKEPSESVSALAREYAGSAGRHTDARSVIQNGIARARQLLSALDLEPPQKSTGC
jgi:hypothetical protein